MPYWCWNNTTGIQIFLQKMTLGGGQHRPVSKITLAAKAALTKDLFKLKQGSLTEGEGSLPLTSLY
jgi:hypothetical protein